MALIDNLTAYWTFDSDATDSTANNNDLTVNGATNVGGGIINNCYSFDGTNDYLEIDNSDFLINTGNFSVSMWIKFDAEPSSQELLTHLYQFYIDYDGAGNIRMWNAVNVAYSTDYENWTHFLATRNGSTVEFWINGVSQGTGTRSNDLTDDKFTIGSRTGGTDNFAGDIDEVGFWDRCLTDAEVGELYNSGSGLQYPFDANPLAGGQVSYWKFDGDADDSVASLDGTANGATNSSSYGKINEGYMFDGLNDSITFSDEPDFGSSFTMNFWVNMDSTSSNRTLYSHYVDTSNYNLIMIYNNGHANANKITMQIRGTYGTSTTLVASDALTEAWTMVTWVHNDSSGNDIIYYNGVSKHSSTSVPITFSGSGTFNFGKLATQNYMDGDLDETGI